MPPRRVFTRRVLRRSLVGTAVVLAALLVVGLATGVALVRRPFPETEGTITLPGLGGEVAVLRDARGVPQIYADSADDLFRAQGYVHAQDRFFEMDWRRHVTAGRLAELVGPDPQALAADRLVRTLGWRRIAAAELEQADPATRRHLEAYARGVNDYLRGRSASQLSMNYPALGLALPMPAIEPWTPVDSLAWFKALAWDLRGNYADEVARALTFGVVRDVARVEQLFPAYPYDRHAPILPGGQAAASSAVPAAGASAETSPAVPPGTGTSARASAGTSAAGAAETSVGTSAGTPPSASDAAVAQALASAPAQEAIAGVRTAMLSLPTGVSGDGGGGDGIGSNSWVVSGRHTASGKPLLANDPHLAPGLPGVWYQVGLHCRSVSPECPFDVSGFSFSGVPGVIIGHNARISWGLTNLSPDVTDLFLEKVTGDRIERDGVLVPLTVRTETIKVAGAPSETLRIRTGPHGPLLSDVVARLTTVGARAPSAGQAPSRGQGYAVALAWTALTPGHDMDAVFGINAATDFASFRAAALRMDAPAQNMVYADVDGHIGYQAPGRIPLRGNGSGANGSGDTGGQVAGAATDGAARPVPVPTDGTWPLPGWTSAYDWKGYVPLADLPSRLDPAEGFVVAANQPVTPPGGAVAFGRTFDYGYRAQRIRDLLSERTSRGDKLTVADMEAIQTDTHNGIAADLVPLILAVQIDDRFYAEAVELLRGWDGSQPVDSAAAAFFNAVWASMLELTFTDELPEGGRPDGGGRWFEVMRMLVKDPTDPWWDDRGTPSVLETRDEIIRQSIVQARNRLTRDLGKDADTWTWGRLHRLALVTQPIGGASATTLIHPLLNEGPIELPGGTSLVNAIGWDASRGDFRVTWAPSMRMVVDLGALDGSRWVNQTGQSGHPGNGHYLDQLEAWATGRTFGWPSSPEAVRAATRQTLTLTPAQPSS